MQATPNDLRILTRGIQRADEACFNRFYDSYAERLYRYLVVLRPQDPDLVRDAFQEAMLRVTRYIREFSDEEAFWRWLTRLARTTLIDLLRRRRKIPADVLDRLAGPEAEDEALPHLLGLLQEALKTLEPGDRTLVENRYLQDRAHDDLAREDGTTVRTVESRLYRLRRQLREFIVARL